MQVGDRFTWTGKIPERVTFYLKPGANYISLPLDTTLEKAVDICDKLGLSDDVTIGAWDVEKQQFLFGGPVKCLALREGFQFDVGPGKVYYVGGLTEEKTWTQR
ncbi:MAG: hypothetical protein ACTSXD_13735 [Candidatus Heimdallarchaeaceae archaeon]